MSDAGAVSARKDDVVRNAFDVMCAAPAVFALDAQSSSWCQWESGGARVGRKRAADAVAPAAGTPRWADAASQRRAFSEAWLSLLRLELPLDIYKARIGGVRALCTWPEVAHLRRKCLYRCTLLCCRT